MSLWPVSCSIRVWGLEARQARVRPGVIPDDVTVRDDRGERPRVVRNVLADHKKGGAHAIALEQCEHVPGFFAGSIVERQRDSVACARARVDAIAGRHLARELPIAPESLLDRVGCLRSGDCILGSFLCCAIDGGLRCLDLAGGRLGRAWSKRVDEDGDDDESGNSERHPASAATDSSLSCCAALRSPCVGHALTISQRSSRACEPDCYSHSIVPGGFEEISSATRLTPSTSLMMRVEMRSRRSYGRRAQSAVIASSLVTARMMIG